MFTSNQIEEIRRKLQLIGVKDTHFPQADSLNGNEIMTIVQQGQNKQLGLKAFIEKVGMYTISDFVNISKNSEDSYTLSECISKVNPINRKAGQVITFMDSNTGDWSIYQFKGNTASEWLNTELWDNILAKSPSHFKGWFLSEEALTEYYSEPMVGDYAFIGETLEDSVVYNCYIYGQWNNTQQPAIAFADKYDAVYSKDFGEFETLLDETYADRATKDAEGNIITDTYVTRDGLDEAMKIAVNMAVWGSELPDGIVTMSSLSDTVKNYIGSKGKVTNLADDEDLTTVDNTLKFADKSYDEVNYSGYGRVFLRKNIIDGVNILEQYQISETNTRYIVQYFHCLNGGTIDVPENCIIDFSAGGAFSNGTLNCNDTVIILPTSSQLNVTLTGTYSYAYGSSSTGSLTDLLANNIVYQINTLHITGGTTSSDTGSIPALCLGISVDGEGIVRGIDYYLADWDGSSQNNKNGFSSGNEYSYLVGEYVKVKNHLTDELTDLTGRATFTSDYFDGIYKIISGTGSEVRYLEKVEV